MTKVKNSKGDKTQKFELWQKSKTQIVTKLTNWNCDKTQKPWLWQNSKTHCDKTQNLNLSKNSKTQIVTKLKTQIGEKLKKWPNSKTQILTKLKISNCAKTKIVRKLKHKFWQNFFSSIFFWPFSKNNLTHWQPRDVFRASFRNTCNVFFCTKWWG